MPDTPEQQARREIDLKLSQSGWIVQNRNDLDLTAGRGIAVREFPMKPGFGFADYLLYLDRKALGAVEAKAEGTLTGVEAQSAKYAAGLPDNLNAHKRPLPFLFESNGTLIHFTNGLDPKPRSREVFSFPRPETLSEWLSQPEQLRARLKELPPLDEAGLWKVQIEAIKNLEDSFAKGDPRALIQMATGSGKTFTAVNIVYRLLKFGGAKRILFLVDRDNLGKQAEDEFANYTPPDDARKFPTLYTVQRLKTNSINPAAKVVITTIQRLYSMLKGEAEFDAENEEGSGFDTTKPWKGDPPDVVYNTAIPPEFFDFVIVDECHRSIYELWAQVVLYFDSFLIGLSIPPLAASPTQLWRAFQAVERDKVKGLGGTHLADLVTLVRHALIPTLTLIPYAEEVKARYEIWLAEKASTNTFTPEQREWLDRIAEHIATSLAIEPDDFQYGWFGQEGSLGKAHALFGDTFSPLLAELNERLAA